MLNAEIVNKDEEIINLVNDILENAVKENATDIHIEPQEKFTTVRYRVDGELYVPEGYGNIPKKLHQYIIARIKILSTTMKLDVTNRPQDGKIRLKIKDEEVIFRLMLLPSIHGESLIMRLLRNEQLFPLQAIFNNDKELLKRFNHNISKSEGIILFTGLAGSGKTNFIASAIYQLADTKKKIITIEDPAELVLENTTQLQVWNKVGNTSELLIRVALRADADIIFVSDFKDYETALIAFEGAMQGHMLFSTMHTNNSVDALFRCTHMGIKEYLSGSVLQLILNTRLAKTTCPHCKAEYKYSKASLQAVGLSEDEIKNNKFYKGKGCDKCDNSGYKGRIAIIEMLEFTTELREAFINGADKKQITKLAKKEGVYYTHKDDALKKFIGGNIDLETARMFTL